MYGSSAKIRYECIQSVIKNGRKKDKTTKQSRKKLKTSLDNKIYGGGAGHDYKMPFTFANMHVNYQEKSTSRTRIKAQQLKKDQMITLTERLYSDDRL